MKKIIIISILTLLTSGFANAAQWVFYDDDNPTIQEIEDVKVQLLEYRVERGEHIDKVVSLALSGTKTLNESIKKCGTLTNCSQRLTEVRDLYVRSLHKKRESLELNYVNSIPVIIKIDKLISIMNGPFESKYERRGVWLENTKDLRDSIIVELKQQTVHSVYLANLSESILSPGDFAVLSSYFAGTDLQGGYKIDDLTDVTHKDGTIIISSRGGDVDDKSCKTRGGDNLRGKAQEFTIRGSEIRINLFGGVNSLNSPMVRNFLNRDQVVNIRCKKINSIKNNYGTYNSETNTVVLSYVRSVRFSVDRGYFNIVKKTYLYFASSIFGQEK